jgi:outer membrane lipoprotein-sorting protein
MKIILIVGLVFALSPCCAPVSSAAPPSLDAACTAKSAQNLEAVLDSMDCAAASFHAAQTDFVWDQYESVVKDTTEQKGVMYIRKSGGKMEMAADVHEPPDQKKYLLYSGGKAQVFQPSINQVTTYDPGANQEALQSFMVLGFGGRGHDLLHQFEVKFGGSEKINGIETGKLELTPQSDRVRGMFDRILLWIDPARGVSVQQKFLEPASGNFRLVVYNNIQINAAKVPDGVFSLKGRVNGKTQYVNPPKM